MQFIFFHITKKAKRLKKRKTFSEESRMTCKIVVLLFFFFKLCGGESILKPV